MLAPYGCAVILVRLQVRLLLRFAPDEIERSLPATTPAEALSSGHPVDPVELARSVHLIRQIDDGLRGYARYISASGLCIQIVIIISDKKACFHFEPVDSRLPLKSWKRETFKLLVGILNDECE